MLPPHNDMVDRGVHFLVKAVMKLEWLKDSGRRSIEKLKGR